MITAFCMPRAFRLDELIFCVGIICWITWYMYYETSHPSVGPTGYTGPESVWNPLPGYLPLRTLLFSLNHFFFKFLFRLARLQQFTSLHNFDNQRDCASWASYQIRKIVGSACAWNAGNVFPATDCDPGTHHGMCETHMPWCMSELLTLGDGENVPGIPSACATCNFLRIW